VSIIFKKKNFSTQTSNEIIETQGNTKTVESGSLLKPMAIDVGHLLLLHVVGNTITYRQLTDK